jgi:DNA-binding MarR family transcriptional regulator
LIIISRMTDEADVLAHELRGTVGRLVRRLRQEPSPIPAGELIVLLRLEREGPASTSDLAAAERMRPQSMAQTVRDLEDAGLIMRRPDPSDRRRALLELTKAGVDTLAAVSARRDSFLSRGIQQELTAAERRTLSDAVGLLRRLADS